MKKDFATWENTDEIMDSNSCNTDSGLDILYIVGRSQR